MQTERRLRLRMCLSPSLTNMIQVAAAAFRHINFDAVNLRRFCVPDATGSFLNAGPKFTLPPALPPKK